MPMRPARPCPLSPNWSGPQSTSTPTALRRWRCGTPAPPATMRSRSWTFWRTTRASRFRRLCLSMSPRRCRGMAGCASTSILLTGWSWNRPSRQSWRRFPATRRSAGCWAHGSMTTPWQSRPPSAAGSSRSCTRSAGRQRTSPDTSTASPTQSNSLKTAGPCATTSTTPPSPSGPAVPASWSCPAARAKRSSAPPRWPRRRPPRSSWSPTPSPGGSGKTS